VRTLRSDSGILIRLSANRNSRPRIVSRRKGGWSDSRASDDALKHPAISPGGLAHTRPRKGRYVEACIAMLFIKHAHCTRIYANRRGFFHEYENIIAGYVRSEKSREKVLHIDKRMVTLDKRRSNSSQHKILHNFYIVYRHTGCFRLAALSFI